MIHTRLVSALKKVGAKVTPNKNYEGKETGSFSASLNGNTIEWSTQSNFNSKLNDYDNQLFVGYVVMRSPYTDIQTDCFCDSFQHTIKGAVQLLQH
jgi:hypothetical protein